MGFQERKSNATNPSNVETINGSENASGNYAEQLGASCSIREAWCLPLWRNAQQNGINFWSGFHASDIKFIPTNTHTHKRDDPTCIPVYTRNYGVTRWDHMLILGHLQCRHYRGIRIPFQALSTRQKLATSTEKCNSRTHHLSFWITQRNGQNAREDGRLD